ncbi:hypothetical protein HYV85_05200 [Candidatus Woesearchaeota archaeon]|nr:hypothetical protein [Candidatus Woesearchaeota archaeon]
MPLDTMIEVAGRTFLTEGDKPAFLDIGDLKGEGVYLKVVGSDVRQGHHPLVHRQAIQGITYKEAFASIEKEERMQAALRFLFKDYGRRQTMLSYLIITGLWKLNAKDGLQLPCLGMGREGLEDKLASEGQGFSSKELRQMAAVVHSRVKARTQQTIYKWITGPTVAPKEFDYEAEAFENSALEQLAAINPEFLKWEQSTGSFDEKAYPKDPRAAYWLYRDLVGKIVGYMLSGMTAKAETVADAAVAKERAAQETGHKRRRPVQIHYPEEISRLVREYIGRVIEKFASPMVLSTGTTSAEQAADETKPAVVGPGRRPSPRLSRGLVTAIPEGFKGRVITVTDLVREREVVIEAVTGVVTEYLESTRQRYETIYDNLFKKMMLREAVPQHSGFLVLEYVLSRLQSLSRPYNQHNSVATVTGNAERGDRRLFAQSNEFSSELADKIMSEELDKRYGTGGQIRASLEILTRMGEALPPIVQLLMISKDSQEYKRLAEEINRTYGVRIDARPVMFALVVHELIITGEIRLGKEAHSHGITAFQTITNTMQDYLMERKHRATSETGINLITKHEATETLASYGLPGMIRFVHPINFLDTIPYIARKNVLGRAERQIGF